MNSNDVLSVGSAVSSDKNAEVGRTPAMSAEMDALSSAVREVFPESAAGGFTHRDGTVEFFGRVYALLTKDSVVLDYGAGRGRGAAEDPVSWRRGLRTFRGHCRKVVGIDVDPVVTENPGLDEAFVVALDQPLPFPDNSFDLVVSDHVFEHIANPAQVGAELERILKPGGWICARTPNLLGYVGTSTNLIPNRLHVRMLKVLQPFRQAKDVFPTCYKLNTKHALRKHFSPASFDHHSYFYTPEPGYFGNATWLWRTVMFFERFVPRVCSPVLMVFIRKR